MKLLQILARELSYWPASVYGCDSITQDPGGELNRTESGCKPTFSKEFGQWIGEAEGSNFIYTFGNKQVLATIATDHATAIITREHWEAERQLGAVWRGPEDGLPPAGTVCEVLYHGEWDKTYIVGQSRTGTVVFECDAFCDKWIYDGYSDPEFFRPIQKERELAIDAIRTFSGDKVTKEIAGLMYDNGFRLK